MGILHGAFGAAPNFAQAGGQAGFGQRPLVGQRLGEQTLLAAVLLHKGIQFRRGVFGSAAQRLQPVERIGEETPRQQIGRQQIHLVFDASEGQIGGFPDAALRCPLQDARAGGFRPAVLRHQIGVVLHGLVPVIHQPLVKVVGVEQRNFVVARQQVFRQDADERFGLIPLLEVHQTFPVRLLPGAEGRAGGLAEGGEIGMFQDAGAHLAGGSLHQQGIGALRRGEERGAQGGQCLPIRVQGVHISRRNAAVQMPGQVLPVFGVAAFDVTRQVQVVLVGFDFAERHHSAVSGDFALPVEGGDDLMDIALPQAVLGAVLAEAFRCVHHEDPAAGVGVFLIQHDDSRRDTRPVKQVGRQPDDALDEAAAHQFPPDAGFGVAPEEYPVRQNHRRPPGAFQRFENVQQKGIIAVFGGRHAILETSECIVGGVQPAGPVLL